jgi:hypothetical protein
MISVLQELDSSRIYRKLGYASLFKYACVELGLNEPLALNYISVARAAREVPALKRALDDKRISVSRAGRIVAAINPDNANELIDFATTHTMRETDFEVGRRNPKVGRDRMRVLSEDTVEITVTISKEAYEKLKRAQDIMSYGENVRLGKVIEAAADGLLDRRDPVRKAQRARSRKLCANRVRAKIDVRHDVHERDEGRCTYIEKDGNRCTNERWIQLHHILPKSLGGSDTPENLVSLCAAHHDLVHQFELPGLKRGKTMNTSRHPIIKLRR